VEEINYEEINNTPIAKEVKKLRDNITSLTEEITKCENQIYNLYSTCKHTYKTDYKCYCGPYDSFRVCTKCGHSIIS